MCRVDIRLSAYEISKQLVNFKILYLNDDTDAYIFSHRCSSNIVNSLYNFSLIVIKLYSNFHGKLLI